MSRDCSLLAVRVTWEEVRVRQGQGGMGRAGCILHGKDRGERLYQGGALDVEGLRHTGCPRNARGRQGEAGAGQQRSGGVKSAGRRHPAPQLPLSPSLLLPPTAPRLFAAAHAHLPFPHSPTSQVMCELSAVHTSPSMGVGFCTATPAPGSTEQHTCTVEGQPAHAPDMTLAASGNPTITHVCQSSSAQVNKGSTGGTQLRQTRACLVLRKGPGHQQGGCEAVNVWGRVASWQLQR